jgi:hypothetical protein
MRRHATDWEKIFAKGISDQGLLPKVFKELLKLNSKEAHTPIQNGQRP